MSGEVSGRKPQDTPHIGLQGFQDQIVAIIAARRWLDIGIPLCQ